MHTTARRYLYSAVVALSITATMVGSNPASARPLTPTDSAIIEACLKKGGTPESCASTRKPDSAVQPVARSAPRTTILRTTISRSAASTLTSGSLATTGPTVRLPRGNWIAQLTSSDCRLAGGTVVVPGDDRCGSLGAAYCRYPDTNAACLTEH